MSRRIGGWAFLIAAVTCAGVAGCVRSPGVPASESGGVRCEDTPEAFALSLKLSLAEGERVQIEKLIPAQAVFSRWEHHGEGQRGPARTYEVPREKALSEIVELFRHPDVTTHVFTEDGDQYVELRWCSPRGRWLYELMVVILRSESGQWLASSVLLGAHCMVTK